MSQFVLFLDIPNNAAAIPGSGNTPSAFTHTKDVGKFVAASLDLEKWEPDTFIIGDKVTWNEFLQHAEAAKGTYEAVNSSQESRQLITSCIRHKVYCRL